MAHTFIELPFLVGSMVKPRYLIILVTVLYYYLHTIILFDAIIVFDILYYIRHCNDQANHQKYD